MTAYVTPDEHLCCELLAENLKFDFDIVLSSFRKHKVYEAVDGLDKQTIDADIECLERALKHTTKTIESLCNLSEISIEKQVLTGVLLSPDAGELGRKLEIVLEQHRNIRRKTPQKAV